MKPFARLLSKPARAFSDDIFSFALVVCTLLGAFGSLGCSRHTAVYADPASPTNANAATVAPVVPVSTDGRAYLPKDFYNQSVNRAAVDLQLDAATSTSKAIRLQTSSGANTPGGFNGSGLGNRAVLGNGAWHARPVAQAEPITFDAKVFSGLENVGVNLQVDLACDGTSVRVVNASGAAIGFQTHTAVSDGYTRFTASTAAAIWLSPTSAIVDPDNAAVLVPSSGTAVSLSALLVKYPAACLKNAATGANDLANGIPTAAVLFTLGEDSSTTVNSTFVRRLTIGSQVYEGLE